MKYTGQYIYPPRPQSGLVIPGSKWFQELEADPRWFAQAKLKGSNTQMVLIDTEVEFFTRHNSPLVYTPTPEQVEFFASLKKYAPLVLNLEMIHRQTKNWKHLAYVFDILVCKGEYLIGSTVEERQRLLAQMFKKSTPTPYEFAVSLAPGVWLAQNFEKGWAELFEKYQALDVFEGLILKRKDAKLEFGFSEKNNPWAIRCRKK